LAIILISLKQVDLHVFSWVFSYPQISNKV
jgi:hypothetical protein